MIRAILTRGELVDILFHCDDEGEEISFNAHYEFLVWPQMEKVAQVSQAKKEKYNFQIKKVFTES